MQSLPQALQLRDFDSSDMCAPSKRSTTRETETAQETSDQCSRSLGRASIYEYIEKAKPEGLLHPDAAADATTLVDELPAALGTHAGPEPHLALLLDLADTPWVVNCHR